MRRQVGHVEAHGAAAAWEQARLRGGGGGGVRVDPSKSFGSSSRLDLLTVCRNKGPAGGGEATQESASPRGDFQK